MMENSEIIIYQNADGNIKVDVRLEDETVWLTQEQMAMLFGKGRSTIAEHIGNVYEERELEQNSTCRKFRQVRPVQERSATKRRWNDRASNLKNTDSPKFNLKKSKA